MAEKKEKKEMIEWIAPVHSMDGQATIAADRNHILEEHPLGVKETVLDADGAAAIVRVYPPSNIKCVGLSVPVSKSRTKKAPAKPAVTK